jgi:tryptophanase
MERGTMSEDRNPDGTEHPSDMELVRLAMPRRVFTMSQIRFAVDRITWLFNNRDIIGGLKWRKEPKIMRFFLGELEPQNDWQKKLVKRFRMDFGEGL